MRNWQLVSEAQVEMAEINAHQMIGSVYGRKTKKKWTHEQNLNDIPYDRRVEPCKIGLVAELWLVDYLRSLYGQVDVERTLRFGRADAGWDMRVRGQKVGVKASAHPKAREMMVDSMEFPYDVPWWCQAFLTEDLRRIAWWGPVARVDMCRWPVLDRPRGPAIVADIETLPEMTVETIEAAFGPREKREGGNESQSGQRIVADRGGDRVDGDSELFPCGLS